MNKSNRAENDLEQRLRDHYQHRYQQPPDSTLIWARVQPQLDRSAIDQPSLLRQVRRLPIALGRLTARQQAALKERYEEQTFMDETIHREQAQTNHRPIAPDTIPSPRRRFKRLIEVSMAAALVASLLVGWLAVTHLYNRPGMAATPLLHYSSQPGETIDLLGWTPDGRYLTFLAHKPASTDKSDSFRVWDVATGQVTQTFSLEAAANEGDSMSPDGRYAFVVDSDPTKGTSTARLVNILTGQARQIYQGNSHQSLVQAAFSHNSKSLAVFVGNELHVWDVATGTNQVIGDPNLISMPGGDPTSGQTVVQVSWSTDDKRIALGVYPESSANGLQIWDARTGHRLATIVETPDMSLSSLSPDMGRILTYNQQKESFAVRDVSTLKILQSFPGQFNGPDADTIPAWLDSGARLLIRQNHQAIIWNTATGQRIASCVLDNIQGLEEPSVVGSNDGVGHYVGCLQQDNQVSVLDVRTGATVNVFSLTTRAAGFSWLSDDKYLSIRDKGNRYGGQVYNAVTGQLVLSYEGLINLSPKGDSLAVISMPPDGRFYSTTVTIMQVFAVH